MKPVFSRHVFFKKLANINLMKIRPVKAELFYADGRTGGHEEAKSRFSLFRKGA